MKLKYFKTAEGEHALRNLLLFDFHPDYRYLFLACKKPDWLFEDETHLIG